MASTASLGSDSVPPNLQRVVTLRLNFPPSYAVVGAYMLCTDQSLYKPAWDKCKHGIRRGLVVGFVWTCLTYSIQRHIIWVVHIIRVVLNNPSSIFSLRYIAGISDTASERSEETFLGFQLQFSVSTYTAILLLGTQITTIITFFLSRNIRIARQRAWDQTVASHGKGHDFWQPYVEEWEVPPVVNAGVSGRLTSIMSKWAFVLMIKLVLLLPLSLYPFVGALARAAIKSLGTAQYLHKPIAVFIEERKWDYMSFGFVAALLEGIPIIGLAFTVSNRIGAAMWAHGMFLYLCYFETGALDAYLGHLRLQGSNADHLDLEKRQHNVAGLKRSGHREKENEGERLKAS